MVGACGAANSSDPASNTRPGFSPWGYFGSSNYNVATGRSKYDAPEFGHTTRAAVNMARAACSRFGKSIFGRPGVSFRRSWLGVSRCLLAFELYQITQESVTGATHSATSHWSNGRELCRLSKRLLSTAIPVGSKAARARMNSATSASESNTSDASAAPFKKASHVPSGPRRT